MESHMRRALIATFAVLATPAAAEEIACEGPFAIDSSEARLIEFFGAENVRTDPDADGPEGSTMLKTFVFPGDPEREFSVVWWHDEARDNPSYFSVPAKATAPGGLRVGMSIAEVEERNGEPFKINGFGWDVGGAANILSGKLSDLPGDCILTLYFHPTRELPDGVDPAPITGSSVEPSSDLPLLRQVEPVLGEILFGYMSPSFR
jgi:hypothetical protein